MTRPEHFYAEPTGEITDFLALWESKPITWSQLYAWRSSKTAWFDSYVLHKKQWKSAIQKRKMDFGNEIGDRIEADPTFAPSIPRLPHFELELSTTFSGVPIAGHLDNCDIPSPLHEFKTGGLAYPWTQAKVDKHKQLDIYVALMWLIHKVKPEDIAVTLFWLPTEDFVTHVERDGEVYEEMDVRLIDTPPVVFHTKRTMFDALNMLKELTRARREMREYIVHQLSTIQPSQGYEFDIQW